MKKTKEQLTEEIKNLICDLFNVNFLDVNDYFEDLGMDSLDAVELAMEVERKYDIRIPESDIDQIDTTAKLIDYVYNKQNN